MPTGRHFAIYEMFYSPPGTPQELKCIGCRIATAGASLTLATVCFSKAKQIIYGNLYSGMAAVIAGFTLGTIGVLSAKMAHEDTTFNNTLIKQRSEELRDGRRQKSVQPYQSKEPSKKIQYT